jgi:Cu(I)/Ag(I) efflux system membrane fusion protein/cobalt-zinc-cadmium efflux system membrane fusion protein
MGMDLIPVYEDQATLVAGGSIRIDPVTVQNMGVRTTMVERGDFTRSIRTVGQIEYNEEKLYIVNTKISGWIETLFVNYVGEMVRKGDPLLEIYSPELVTTQEEYLLALDTQRRLAQSNFESIRDGAESLFAESGCSIGIFPYQRPSAWRRVAR